MNPNAPEPPAPPPGLRRSGAANGYEGTQAPPPPPPGLQQPGGQPGGQPGALPGLRPSGTANQPPGVPAFGQQQRTQSPGYAANPQQSPHFQPFERVDPPYRNRSSVDMSSSTGKALIAASVVAVLGALVWGWLISAIEIEIGWLAWGIGWGIGFAFYKLGGAGTAGVLACGALALASMLGGKYLGASMLIDQMSEKMGDLGALFQNAGTPPPRSMGGMADELGDDWYEDDFDFDAPSRPSLTMSRTPSISLSISPWRVVEENLGFLDVLFGILGLGTAVMVAARGAMET